MYFEIYRDKVGDWRWRLKAKNHKIIADSVQSYRNQKSCLYGIQFICSASSNTPIHKASNVIQAQRA